MVYSLLFMTHLLIGLLCIVQIGAPKRKSELTHDEAERIRAEYDENGFVGAEEQIRLAEELGLEPNHVFSRLRYLDDIRADKARVRRNHSSEISKLFDSIGGRDPTRDESDKLNEIFEFGQEQTIKYEHLVRLFRNRRSRMNKQKGTTRSQLSADHIYVMRRIFAAGFRYPSRSQKEIIQQALHLKFNHVCHYFKKMREYPVNPEAKNPSSDALVAHADDLIEQLRDMPDSPTQAASPRGTFRPTCSYCNQLHRLFNRSF